MSGRGVLMGRRKSRVARVAQEILEASPSEAPRIETGAAWWRRWAPEFLVGALALLVYLSALGGGFVSDALVGIAYNPALVRSRDWLAWFGRDFYWGSSVQDVTLYRPLTVLSFLLHLRTTGLRPLPFLLGNALLHAGVSVLVLRLGTRLVGRVPAVVGALIFAVHPLHAEAVAWVMGRAELLAGFFAMAACLGFLRATDPAEPNPWRFILGTVGAYFAALLSKEQVAVLPLWFGLAWALDRPHRSGKAAAYVGIGSALALAGFLVLRAGALTREPLGETLTGLHNPAAVVSAPLRWLTAAAVVARYARLLFWPFRLSHDYSYAQLEASTGMGGVEAAGLLVILAVLGAIIVAWRQAPGVALALALAPITFFLVSNVPFPIGTIMAERLTYLPSVGVVLVVGWAVARLPRPAHLDEWVGTTEPGAFALGRATSRGSTKPLAAPGALWLAVWALAAVLLVLSVRTVVRNYDWRDNYSLYSAALRVSPKSAHVQTVLSVLERSRGNTTRAMELVQEALRTFPNSAAGRTALAEVHFVRREYREAGEQYQLASALSPKDAVLRVNLGVAWKRAGLPAEAERALKEAVRVAPDLTEARLALGGLLLDGGRPAEALQQFGEASRLRPRDPVAMYGIASAALATGDRKTAETFAHRAADAGLRVPDEFWRSLRGSP